MDNGTARKVKGLSDSSVTFVCQRGRISQILAATIAAGTVPTIVLRNQIA
jgi:hypothetical protein